MATNEERVMYARIRELHPLSDILAELETLAADIEAYKQEAMDMNGFPGDKKPLMRYFSLNLLQLSITEAIRRFSDDTWRYQIEDWGK